MSNSAPQARDSADADRVLVDLDPATLIIAANVRAVADVDQALVDSVTERGVLVPVVAHRTGDGAVAVLYGQRRTLAAVAAGRASIPVYLVATPTEADRLTDQMGENDHRAPLRTDERIAAYAQLSALGLSAAQIAQRTATARTEVAAAITTAASEVATSAAQAYDHLTLEQAAVLAEFDGDPVVAERLIAASRRENFAHALQAVRDQKARDQRIAERAEQVRATGTKVIDAPAWDDKPKGLFYLRQDGQVIGPAEHARCPGHAVYIACSFQMAPTAPEVDQAVDEVDGHDEQAEPEHQEGEQWVEVLREEYLCTDPSAYGHTRAGATARQGAAGEEVSEAEQARRAEQRRTVIENNRAWVSAEKVRRAWLATFAKRKTSPPGAARFIAATLAANTGLLTRAGERGHALAHDLLGAKRALGRSAGQVLITERTTPARSTHVALVLALAAHEEATSKSSWRHLDPATATYLSYLGAAGYSLADIERTTAGLDTEPDQAPAPAPEPAPEVDAAA